MVGLSFLLSRCERGTSVKNTAMCRAVVKCRSRDIKRLKKIIRACVCVAA